MKVSDFITSFLEKNLVKHIFSISGAGNIHLLKSISENPNLVSIHPHQEQAGVLSSLAYYRICGRLGVMIVTSGGAATNAITGALDAWADSIPCIIISGQEKSEFVHKHKALRMWGVQGFDICKTVDNITKYSTLIIDKNKIKYELQKAFHIALSGRPGPVWIDIPTDIQAATIDENELEEYIPESVESKITNSNIEFIKNQIKISKRPVFIFGNGIRLSGAEKLLKELITKFKIPFITAWNGLDLISSYDELNFGRTGTYGQRCANFVVQNSDLVIAIGTRLAIPQVGYDLSEYARTAKKVVIDIDKTELDKFSTDSTFTLIESDAQEFILKMLSLNLTKDTSELTEWIDQCNHWRNEYPYVQKDTIHREYEGFLNSYSFIDELQSHFSEQEIIVTDMGTALTCTHQTLKIKTNQRLVTSTGLGEMGYGLPGAIGASLARDNQRVVLINGDGSMMMNLQEMQTIIELKLPIKLFVYINDGYLTIKHTQFNLFGNNYAGSGKSSGVSCPDFELIGKAFGFKTYKIKSIEDAQNLVPEILNSIEPVLCEVFIHPMQPLVPKTSFNINPDGTLISPPLEDLFPFLDRAKLEEEMLIPVHQKSKNINLDLS